MKLPDFLIIPCVLIVDKTLQPLDREVYGLIYWASKLKNEKCTFSNKTIAELLQVNEGSVSHSLTRLKRQRYIHIVFSATKERLEIAPLVFFKGGVDQIINGVDQMIIRGRSNDQQNKSINNNINNKDFLDSSSSLEAAPDQPQTSMNSVMPLTSTDRWNMAKKLDVPLWVVKKTEQNFWDYVENPKNLKKYTTSYRTIYKWIRMGLEKGQIQNMNEVERMDLEGEHPDVIAKNERLLNWAKEEKIIE